MNEYPSSTQCCEVHKTAPPIYFLTEILVRIILLSIVCIMHASLQPHVQYITETELLHNYKRPRNDSIVPAWIMIILIIFIPIISFIVPCIHARNFADTPQSLLAWSLACAINAFVTETGKLIVGRPRPDFFYRCFPNGKMTKDLRCNGNLKDVIEGRKSFPSGHSSFSFCSLGFVSVWMCGKMGVVSSCRGNSAKVIACLVPLVAAGAVALSRMCDNHHHWEDVLAGSLIGIMSSSFCYRQYYHPLDSERAGSPYIVFNEREWFIEVSEEDCCCTKDLEVKKSINDNKIYNDFNKNN